MGGDSCEVLIWVQIEHLFGEEEGRGGGAARAMLSVRVSMGMDAYLLVARQLLDGRHAVA